MYLHNVKKITRNRYEATRPTIYYAFFFSNSAQTLLSVQIGTYSVQSNAKIVSSL